MPKIIVLNIGGSILSPNEDVLFDFNAAKKIKDFIVSLEQYQFILCVGGGSIARKYQKLLEENSFSKNSEHEVGIAAINMNAYMLKAVLEDIAENNVLKYSDFDTDNPITFEKKVLISAAGAPGHSSDWNTVKLAIRAGESKVFSLTNIDGVYNKDPKKFPDATIQPKLSWTDYLNIIGNPTEHQPGAKYPVDPFASKLAMENNIEFFVLSNQDLNNLNNAINGLEFVGSIIS